MAHIYQTSNKGQSWQSVSGNLPDVPVNDLVLDPSDPFNIWYIATDVGVFGTLNGGADWQVFNTGLPTVPVTDLTVHAPSRTIAAATFGRSMYRAILPVYSGTKSPRAFENARISPNPLIDKAWLCFDLFEPQAAQLALFDLTGKRVKILFDGPIQAGAQGLELDGSGLPAGIYLLKMKGVHGAGFCEKVVIK
jgi:hypothetical protein